MFESVVDGSMRFGRWLYAVHPGAEDRMNALYESWLGTHPSGAALWRTGATVVSELGWCLSGSGRAVVDVPMRRCSLHLLEPGDLYRDVFILGHM